MNQRRATLGILVLARLTSRRLPGKALRIVAGRPLVSYVIRRASRATARVILATSGDPSDDPLAAFAAAEGWECFRGSLDDVMGRCLSCCDRYSFEAFARVNGDSPWLDPELLTTGFDMLTAGQLDFVTNLVPRTYPYGVSCEIIRTDALRRVAERTTDANDREHFTQPFYRSLEAWRVARLHAPEDWSNLRLVVDTAEDLRRFGAIIESFPEWESAAIPSLVAHLRRHPELSSSTESRR